MTATLDRQQPARTSAPRRGPTTAVEVLVCGSLDRGDDAAPMIASARFRAHLPADVRVRNVGQLDVDHLLSIAQDAAVVIVDAATGIDPGTIVELPLTGLLGPSAGVRARSSHALAIPAVIGLAEMIRGRPLRGRIVAIGASHFGFGRPLTRRVERGIDALSEAVIAAVAHARSDEGVL